MMHGYVLSVRRAGGLFAGTAQMLNVLGICRSFPPPPRTPRAPRPRVVHSSPLRRLVLFRNIQAKSTGGAFAGCVAAGDGLFVKTIAPTAVNTPNVLSFFSGHKNGYGLNVQATCDANYRFCSMSAIAAGSTND